MNVIDLLCVCQVPGRNFWVIFKCTVIYLPCKQGMYCFLGVDMV